MAIPGATESALDFHFHTFASAMAVEITGDHNLLVEKPSLEINFARAVIAASDNRVTWMQRWPDRAQLVANPEGFTYDPL